MEPIEVEISKETTDLVESRAKIVILTDADMLSAGEYLKKIKSHLKRIGEFFDPLVKSAHETHKKLTTQKRTFESTLLQAEQEVKAEMAGYQKKQEHLRQEEADKLQKELQRQEETIRLNAAIRAEEAGNNALAERILEQQGHISAVVLPGIPKQEGISYSEVWKFEVVDLMELVKAVSAGKVPLSAIQANQLFLGQQARSLKGLFSYPGVKVWSEKDVRAKI